MCLWCYQYMPVLVSVCASFSVSTFPCWYQYVSVLISVWASVVICCCPCPCLSWYHSVVCASVDIVQWVLILVVSFDISYDGIGPYLLFAYVSVKVKWWLITRCDHVRLTYYWGGWDVMGEMDGAWQGAGTLGEEGRGQDSFDLVLMIWKELELEDCQSLVCFGPSKFM